MQGERSVGVVPMQWERFKNWFLDRFCPLEMREDKILEFINLSHGGMSVDEWLTICSKWESLCRMCPT